MVEEEEEEEVVEKVADGCERPLQRPQHAATPVAWRSGIGEGNILERFPRCSNQIFWKQR